MFLARTNEEAHTVPLAHAWINLAQNIAHCESYEIFFNSYPNYIVLHVLELLS